MGWLSLVARVCRFGPTDWHADVGVSNGYLRDKSSSTRLTTTAPRENISGCERLCYNSSMATPKLIFLRGPSGVGKSTVAQALMSQTSRPTVLVDLDYYRFGFVNRPEDWDGPEYEMSSNDILIGLRMGYDVIFDGNFSSDPDDPFIKKLFDSHPQENYLFYLDASLPETLRRHKTKTSSRITPGKMKEVYKFASPVGIEQEVVIPEGSSLEQTVRKIKEITGI